MRFQMMCSKDPTHTVLEKKIGDKCECGGVVVPFSQEELFIHHINVRAKQLAPNFSGTKEHREIKVALCMGCGTPVIRGVNVSSTGKDEVIIDTDSVNVLCIECDVIRKRYPEVFTWVNATSFWRSHQVGIMQMIMKKEEYSKTSPESLCGSKSCHDTGSENKDDSSSDASEDSKNKEGQMPCVYSDPDEAVERAASLSDKSSK